MTLLALAAWLARGAGAETPTVWTELLRLPTADGQHTAAIVMTPLGRAPRGGVALVHGYAGNFYGEPGASLARGLAERGFVTIAANLRDHDGGPKVSRFEDGRFEVQAAVDELARRGVAPVTLVGHSLGTNWVLFYLAEASDSRVAAGILLAGLGNAFEWNVRQFGRDEATRVLDEALQLQRAGRGSELMLVDLGPLGKALYSADHLVSLRGPATRSDPYRNIARVTVPMLLVYAGADRLVEPGVGRRLRAAASSAPRVDLVDIAGADHDFSTHLPALTGAVERWLAEALGR